jgi:hypothetical protein
MRALSAFALAISGAANYVQQAHDGLRDDGIHIQRCHVGTDGKTCPLPVVHAYANNDKVLDVTRTMTLLDQDGEAVNQQITTVPYNKRCTVLLKYETRDPSGNVAETKLFKLILQDTTEPKVTPAYTKAEVVEAGTSWKLSSRSFAVDNIDGKVPVRYNVFLGEKLLCSNCAYADAANKVTTMQTGQYTVGVLAFDKAGRYGLAGRNNLGKAKMSIEVVDTSSPWITVTGQNPATHECGTRYTDEGATGNDSFDNALKKSVLVEEQTSVEGSKKGVYTVTYSAADSSGNKAKAQTRKVKVVDTTKPTVTLIGGSTRQYHSDPKAKLPVDPGVICDDACDTGMEYVTEWLDDFNYAKLGTYRRKYTCTDSSGNSQFAVRTFVVVDKLAPTISLNGKSEVTVEAGTPTYVDDGASCTDLIDGDLDNKVTSSGKVDTKKVGTYKISYGCTDSKGNKATAVARSVTVKDTKCPSVKLIGLPVLNIEAGFQYIDAGATASDSFDGAIPSANVVIRGDDVDTKTAFRASTTCADIKAQLKSAKSADYYVSGENNRRTKVFCDMEQPVPMTYFACKNCKAVAPYGEAQGDCAKNGLVMMKWTKDQAASKEAAIKLFTEPAEEESKYFPKSKGAVTNYYLCTTGGTSTKLNHAAVKHSEIAHAENGKYIISYHVKDAAGNPECKPAYRTIIVRDTLVPIIALRVGNKLIQKSDGSAVGINDVANPANLRNNNPFLNDVA